MSSWVVRIEKLGLTRVTLAESVIGHCQDAIVIYMILDLQTQNVFCEFTHSACQYVTLDSSWLDRFVDILLKHQCHLGIPQHIRDSFLV